jgi:hypothetical protein
MLGQINGLQCGKETAKREASSARFLIKRLLFFGNQNILALARKHTSITRQLRKYLWFFGYYFIGTHVKSCLCDC